MKFHISVELRKDGKPLTAEDLKTFGTINFVKAAPKAFKRAMKATCWPFDADIQIELVDEPKGKKRGIPKDRSKKS